LFTKISLTNFNSKHRNFEQNIERTNDILRKNFWLFTKISLTNSESYIIFKGGENMKFTKMQGAGNDYVYVNCFEETVVDAPRISRIVSDRHFGIGADGLILICSSKVADFRMDMYNADGSQAEMCGNGIRCVGKYVYDHGCTKNENITIETLAGVKQLKLIIEDDVCIGAQVDMGIPVLEPEKIPVKWQEYFTNTPIISKDLEIDGVIYKVTCVSMGNPHAIIFVNDVEKVELERIGPKIENHIYFPSCINTEFVSIIDKSHLKMRVWERGSGETLACGTGACAVLVAAVLNNLANRDAEITLNGGKLNIKWDEESNHVFMEGPAVEVFTGEIDFMKEGI